MLILFLFFSPLLKAQSLYFPPLIGSTWDTLSPASLGWCQNEIDSLSDYLQNNNTKAFILLKDGKIVIERYYGTFTADSLWYWASAGKTLTSFTVGIAQQENFLTLSDTSADYIGNGWTICPPLKERKITIRNQLTMTSGLNDAVPDPYCTLDTCLQYLADAGTRWAYHNGPYTLLDSVIESATGQSLNNYLNSKVKVPTGITGSFFKVDYNNVFVSKARSMARFGLLMLNHGNWNGNQIMTDTAYFNQMITTSQNLNLSYGYLWWLNGKSSYMVPGLQFVFPGSMNPSAPADMYAALGKNGQILNVVPSMNLVYIRMGDAPGAGEVPVTFNDTIWQKLNAVMCTPSSLQPVKNKLDWSLSPNPANDQLKIVFRGEKEIALTLMDQTGRVMFHRKELSDELILDVKTILPGVYFLQLKNEKGLSSVKRIVIL